MRVRLLGTGDAAGWPNPFCDCDSCTAERAAGRARMQTCVLIDEVIALDCGPTLSAAANRYGTSLHGVAHVLVTHGHPDHCDPRFLLTRSWSTAATPLHVWGPALAIDGCRHWVGPDDRVELHAVNAQPVATWTLDTEVGEYRVTALRAAHRSPSHSHSHSHSHSQSQSQSQSQSASPADERTFGRDVLAEEAVIYDVCGPDGARMLYATDTGPLPDDVLSAMTGSYDLVLIEQTFGPFPDHGTGHHDAASLERELRRLRRAGCVHDRTRVVAVHLGHHNPPLEDLRSMMAAMHVDIVDDGTELAVTAADTRQAPDRAAGRALVLGGTRSGKTAWAEARAGAWSADGHVLVVATGYLPDPQSDASWADRVQRHRESRPAAWRTIETADPAAVIRTAEVGVSCIVDCVGMWLTRLLDDAQCWSDAPRARMITDAAVADLVDALHASRAHVVLVSNEVGMALVPTTPSGRIFTDLLGAVNARLARACDDVVLMVAGRALPLTAAPG